MACNQLCAVFILFLACQAELDCNQNKCGEERSRYKERYEAQSVVEESPYMISSEDFFYNFVAKHRPFVMRKAANNWPASKRWTEEYLIHSFSEDPHVSVTKGIQNYPFSPKHHLTIKEFFVRSTQEDLTLSHKPTTQMLNDITAPLCLRCQQFMKNMKVFYWLRHYHSEASTSLFFHPNEQLFAVVNGSVKVTLVSPLYSEKLPFNDETLLAIPSFNTDVLSSGGIPHLTVNLHKGDMLYIPQLWWQRITLSAGNNQFVQFLWPSNLETKSYLKSSSETKQDHPFSSMQASLRSLIRKYEERFLSMDVSPLDCPQQDKRMSDYTFETGKMTPEEYQAVHNGPDFTEDDPCNFDINNQHSPCHFETCLEDPESPVCIRYILEYCSQWEDRGCSIELPQLLNKVDRNTMDQITNMKSPYLY